MTEEFNLEELTQAIRNGRMIPERSREYWSEEEQEKLVSFYQAGVGITKIALELQRSENAVIQQLITRSLLTPPGATRSKRRREAHCLCDGCQLVSVCEKNGECRREEQDA